MQQQATTTRPTDFDAYWHAVDDELARYPASAERTHSPRRSTEFSTGYDVRLTSIGPYRIFGYLSVPKGSGPFPALLNTPRYGSVNAPPHYDDRQRYVVLTLMHRGQRLADQPFAAEYPGLLTLGIDDPATYIYRAIVADCLRGAEWLRSLPEVAADRVGIVGDDLAVITAARRNQIAALQVTGLMFYRLLEARRHTAVYPLEEVNDVIRFDPDREERIAETLRYVDPIHHAPGVRAATVLVAQDPGAYGGPAWLDPLRVALGGPVELYRAAHEGGTDHDWLDAWMAARLGAVAKPRLWTVVR
ncbi:MAG: acetylxylan esterase [Thermomicrobiales bacterium]